MHSLLKDQRGEGTQMKRALAEMGGSRLEEASVDGWRLTKWCSPAVVVHLHFGWRTSLLPSSQFSPSNVDPSWGRMGRNVFCARSPSEGRFGIWTCTFWNDRQHPVCVLVRSTITPNHRRNTWTRKRRPSNMLLGSFFLSLFPSPTRSISEGTREKSAKKDLFSPRRVILRRHVFAFDSFRVFYLSIGLG